MTWGLGKGLDETAQRCSVLDSAAPFFMSALFLKVHM